LLGKRFFTDAYIDIVKKEWAFVKDILAAAGGVSALKGLGLKGAIVLAIAAVLTLAVDVFVALWAPADLIIEDAMGFTTVDLAELTSADFPAPAEVEYSTAGGIDVKVTPLDKGALEYSETRQYVSDDEDSRYEIKLRYNRVVRPGSSRAALTRRVLACRPMATTFSGKQKIVRETLINPPVRPDASIPQHRVPLRGIEG